MLDSESHVYYAGMNEAHTNNGDKTMTNSEAHDMLIEMEATHERKEDASGDTKSGWWMDTVWLAPYSQPRAALAAIEGN